MSNKNDITGDTIATKATTQAYRDNYDAIFGKKKKPEKQTELSSVEKSEQNPPQPTPDAK